MNTEKRIEELEEKVDMLTEVIINMCEYIDSYLPNNATLLKFIKERLEEL